MHQNGKWHVTGERKFLLLTNKYWIFEVSCLCGRWSWDLPVRRKATCGVVVSSLAILKVTLMKEQRAKGLRFPVAHCAMKEEVLLFFEGI